MSALALFARVYLQPLTGQRAPFVAFYLAVILTVWILGTGPAVLVASAGALAGLYSLHDSTNLPGLINSADAIWTALYILTCASFIYVVDAQLRAKADLVREVAARRKAEQQQAEHREWYETTLRSIGDAVIATDHEGRVKFLNPVAETMTGWSSAEAVNLPIEDVFVVQSEHPNAPVEVPVLKVIREGRTHGLSDSTVLVSRTGWRVPIDHIAAPIRNSAGRLVGVVLVFRDITHRKESERALSQSLADMEQFAYVASHDLQEPLRSISIFSMMLDRGYRSSLDGKALDYLRFILDGTQRMQQLVSDLLEYSRAGASALSMQQVSMDEVLQDSLEAVRGQIELTGAVVTHDALPTIYGDRLKLRLVMQNLLSNALKFRGERRCEVHISAELQEGAWLISVRDNGVGFEQIYARQIFGMFRRLCAREQYPGSGIGLAICNRIIESHQGRIWAESEPGKGSTFHFTLPVTTARAANSQN